MDIFLLVFFIIIVYVITLIILKKAGYVRKEKCKICNNCCSECKSILNRLQRKNMDHILKYLTFQIFDFKRYICINCGWDGLRWEKHFDKSNN